MCWWFLQLHSSPSGTLPGMVFVCQENWKKKCPYSSGGVSSSLPCFHELKRGDCKCIVQKCDSFTGINAADQNFILCWVTEASNVWFQKISIPPLRRALEILRWRCGGCQKPKFLKENRVLNWNFHIIIDTNWNDLPVGRNFTTWSQFRVIVWLEICVQLQSVLQALKGLALLRSGKTAESEALMEEIMEAKPADDPTLQAMTICYREMQKRKNNFLKDIRL